MSYQLLRLPFEHRSLSVLHNVDALQVTNPLIKAPTLVGDDGQVLMDSTLILAYGKALAPPRRLLPQPLPDLQQALRVVDLARGSVTDLSGAKVTSPRHGLNAPRPIFRH